MRSRRRSGKRYLPYIAIALLLALIAFLYRESETRTRKYAAIAAQAAVTEPERQTTQWEGKTYALRNDLKTMVLIGTDEDPSLRLKDSGNPGQCDFLAAVIWDEKKETLTLLPINRDTMCVVPILDAMGQPQGTLRQQIALAHTYGTGGLDSCQNVVKSVSNLLYGMKIDGFIRINMDSIALINDAVGGVEVTLADDFSHIDPDMTAGSTLNLDGRQAELFVRARGGMAEPTNLNRMERQKVYLEGFIQAAREQDAAQLLGELSEEITSNLNIYEIADFSEAAKHDLQPTVLPISGNAIRGSVFMEFEVDEEALQQLVIDLFYEQMEVETQ